MMRYTNQALNDIRNMDYYDFQMHLSVSLVAENIDREYQLGNVPGAKKKVDPKEVLRHAQKMETMKTNKTFNPLTGEFE